MNAKSIRVLLIETDQNEYGVLSRMLASTAREQFEIQRVTRSDILLRELARGYHDVGLIDEHDQPQSGIALLRDAAAIGNAIPLIVLSEFPDPHADTEAMQAGAADYLLKSQLTSALLKHAIRYAIERREQAAQIQRQNAYLQALHRTSLAVLDRNTVDHLLTTIVTKAAQLLVTEHAYLALGEPDGTKVEIKIAQGLFVPVTGDQYERGRGMVGQVFATGEPVLIEDYATWSGRIHDQITPLIHGLIGVPLRSSGQTVGTLGIAFEDTRRRIGMQELDMLSRFAELASLALDNSRLYESAQRNLAARQRVESVWQKQEQRFRAAIDGSLDSIFIWEAIREDGQVIDMVVVEANPPAERILTRPRTQVLGARLTQFSPDAEKNGTLDKIRRVIATGEPLEEEIELSVPGIAAQWVHRQIVRLGDGVVMSARDIARRKQTEDSLARTRELLRAILEAATDAFVMCDPDGRIVLTNRAANSFFGVDDGSASSLRQQPVRTLFDVLDDAKAFQATVDDLFTTPERRMSGEVTLGGTRRSLVWVSSPVRADDETVLGRVWVFRDATRERDADRFKTEFIGRVSHEFRTPLTSIKGFVDLILDGHVGPISDDVREFLLIANTSTELLAAIVNDILDLTRIDAHSVALHHKVLNLGECVQSVVHILRPQFTSRQQQITTVIDADLPPIHADAQRLEQILINLLTNAHKYSPNGGAIDVRVRFATPADGDNLAVNGLPMLAVDVSDTGIGIAPEFHDRIFERFYRVADLDTQKVGGTGLGLSIVRSLVDLHGGVISVRSAVGAGSTFSFTLPVISTAQS